VVLFLSAINSDKFLFLSSMSEVTKIAEKLALFLPDEGLSQVVELINKHRIVFKINRFRSTKFGDYRYDLRTGKEQISVNGDLNPYSFYFTSIHEFAHLEAYHQFGRRIKPHGQEWKNTFVRLLLEGKAADWFPEIARNELIRFMHNPKASTASDQQLFMALKKLDPNSSKDTNVVYLQELSAGTKFVLDNRVFSVIQKRRTRYLCTEDRTKRQFLVSGAAAVQLI